MKIGKRWLALGGLLFLGLAVLAAFLEPNGIVPAYLAGEAFYRGRPLRYWREVLRERSKSGKNPRSPVWQLYMPEALPMLRECGPDPDVIVRSLAIGILRASGRRSQEALDILVEALQDDSIDVRLTALDALK